MDELKDFELPTAEEYDGRVDEALRERCSAAEAALRSLGVRLQADCLYHVGMDAALYLRRCGIQFRRRKNGDLKNSVSLDARQLLKLESFIADLHARGKAVAEAIRALPAADVSAFADWVSAKGAEKTLWITSLITQIHAIAAGHDVMPTLRLQEFYLAWADEPRA